MRFSLVSLLLFDAKGVGMWILFSLSLLCLLFVDAKDGGDPHYREMNKQLRDNARVTLLLKEDVQTDDFSKLHSHDMDNYHQLLPSVFRNIGLKSFDYSCSVRKGFERYHTVREVLIA